MDEDTPEDADQGDPAPLVVEHENHRVALGDAPGTTRLEVKCVYADTHAPVPDAIVEFGAGQAVVSDAVSDASGIAIIHVPNNRPLEWMRAKHNECFAVASPRRMDDTKDPLTVEFFGAWSVSGLVFAPDSSPVPGAHVQLTWPTLSGLRLESKRLGKTDKAGKFEVVVRSTIPEHAVLVVTHWKYPSKHVNLVEEDHQLRKHTARVFMDAGVRIAGQVVDSKGRPVPNGVVTMFTTSTPLLPGWEPNYMMGNMARQFGLVRIEADIAEDGTFRLDGWPQDRPGLFGMRVPGRPLKLELCPGGKLDPKRSAAIFRRGEDLKKVVVRFTRTLKVLATGRIRGLKGRKPTDLVLDIGGGVLLRIPTKWKSDGGFRARLLVDEDRIEGKEVRMKFHDPAAAGGCEWGPYLISGDLVVKDLSGIIQ